MNRKELNELLKLLNEQEQKPVEPELRLYYDGEGRVVTYTCENLPGDYILVTPQQFAEARPDVVVKNGKIVYTHRLSHIQKLTKNTSIGVRTSKYDINVLEPTGQEYTFWKIEIYEV